MSIQGKMQKGDIMVNIMTRLELLTLLYSIQALLESGNSEKAQEVIAKVLKEAENNKDEQK